MIVLEKILLLKSITLFEQIPIELLLQMIESSVKEKFVNAGELIIKKGEKGNDMYVIASGRVKIHDEKTTLMELGHQELFGELAALSFGNRVSSVSAISDCLLLKINSNALYELMNLDIGLAKGIIKGLCERTEFIARQLLLVMQEVQQDRA